MSVDRNFGDQIAGGSISAYAVWINSRILLATHSQKNQEKIRLKPPIQSDCGRYLLTCLLPKLFIIGLKQNKINSARVAVHQPEYKPAVNPLHRKSYLVFGVAEYRYEWKISQLL